MSTKNKHRFSERASDYTIQTLLAMDVETMCAELDISQDDILAAFHIRVALYEQRNATHEAYYSSLIDEQIEEENFRIYRKGVDEDEWNE